MPKDIDGPQGLNIDVTYQQKKKAWLENQRNKEYNDLIQKVISLRRSHCLIMSLIHYSKISL